MGNKYQRPIVGFKPGSANEHATAMVDVYDVLRAFHVTCPATQHAVKKLLMPGHRGHKDTFTDLIEAEASVKRAVELASRPLAAAPPSQPPVVPVGPVLDDSCNPPNNLGA